MIQDTGVVERRKNSFVKIAHQINLEKQTVVLGHPTLVMDSFLSPEAFLDIINKHDILLMNLQDILLFRRPFIMMLLVLIIELYFRFVYKSKCGFFASLILLLIVVYILVFFGNHFFHAFSNQNNFDQSKEQYFSNQQISVFLSKLFRFVCSPIVLLSKETPTISEIILTFSFLVLLRITGIFWVSFAFVHILLFFPIFYFGVVEKFFQEIKID